MSHQVVYGFSVIDRHSFDRAKLVSNLAPNEHRLNRFVAVMGSGKSNRAFKPAWIVDNTRIDCPTLFDVDMYRGLWSVLADYLIISVNCLRGRKTSDGHHRTKVPQVSQTAHS